MTWMLCLAKYLYSKHSVYGLLLRLQALRDRGWLPIVHLAQPQSTQCTAIATTFLWFLKAETVTDFLRTNRAAITSCSEEEVSKFTFSAKSEENGGGVEFYHDNIRKKMSQTCHRGVHQRVEIKVANSSSKLCLADMMK